MKSAFFALSLLCLPISAFGQIVVLGSGDAQTCYQFARDGNPGSSDALRTCLSALQLDLLRKDEAATHINTGILYMRNGEYDKSRVQYQSAIALSPNLPEAYINYGAALIYMYETDAAIETLTKAISLEQTQQVEKLPEALFNRSIAYDRKLNYKAAYLDLKRALELRPDWPPAVAAIKRYDVKSPA